MPPEEGENQVIIEGVSPENDGGRFPIKRIAGDEEVVEAAGQRPLAGLFLSEGIRH